MRSQTLQFLRRLSTSPAIASKRRSNIDIKSIRRYPDLYAQNARERAYDEQATYPALINELHEQWLVHQSESISLRKRRNILKLLIANRVPAQDSEKEYAGSLVNITKEQAIEESRTIKESLSVIEEAESKLTVQINDLAAAIPSLTRDQAPRDNYRQIYTSPHLKAAHTKSHVDIGLELKLLDFTAATTTSGWGWYFLTGDAVLLAQSLVLYAQSLAHKQGWQLIEPPSIVRTDIAYASGFQPRDPNSKSQIFKIAQHVEDIGIKPELCLAGTAEIPLAGMKADCTLEEAELPLKYVAASRCYRQEAGARGLDTKGLYRLKEFTKLEMFAWTLPTEAAAIAAYDSIITLQQEILSSLRLPFRVLEMPSTDLGASAWCKTDIEAWFPSRRAIDNGYGEVTSTSICTDYQTRRLGTRVNLKSQGTTAFPYTVNGTALAVPRVLAAILENGWDEVARVVRIPEVLWPFLDGVRVLKAGNDTPI